MPTDGVENHILLLGTVFHKCQLGQLSNRVVQVFYSLTDPLSACSIHHWERSVKSPLWMWVGLSSHFCWVLLHVPWGSPLGLHTLGIVIFWLFLCFSVMNWPSLSLGISLVLRSALSDISITTPAFFGLGLWQWFSIISYYTFLFHSILCFSLWRKCLLGFPWGYVLSLLKMSFIKALLTCHKIQQL